MIAEPDIHAAPKSPLAVEYNVFGENSSGGGFPFKLMQWRNGVWATMENVFNWTNYDIISIQSLVNGSFDNTQTIHLAEIFKKGEVFVCRGQKSFGNTTQYLICDPNFTQKSTIVDKTLWAKKYPDYDYPFNVNTNQHTNRKEIHRLAGKVAEDRSDTIVYKHIYRTSSTILIPDHIQVFKLEKNSFRHRSEFYESSNHISIEYADRLERYLIKHEILATFHYFSERCFVCYIHHPVENRLDSELPVFPKYDLLTPEQRVYVFRYFACNPIGWKVCTNIQSLGDYISQKRSGYGIANVNDAMNFIHSHTTPISNERVKDILGTTVGFA